MALNISSCGRLLGLALLLALFSIIAGCVSQSEPELSHSASNISQIERNKLTVMRYMDALSTVEYDAVAVDVLAANYRGDST